MKSSSSQFFPSTSTTHSLSTMDATAKIKSVMRLPTLPHPCPHSAARHPLRIRRSRTSLLKGAPPPPWSKIGAGVPTPEREGRSVDWLGDCCRPTPGVDLFAVKECPLGFIHGCDGGCSDRACSRGWRLSTTLHVQDYEDMSPAKAMVAEIESPAGDVQARLQHATMVSTQLIPMEDFAKFEASNIKCTFVPLHQAHSLQVKVLSSKVRIPFI